MSPINLDHPKACGCAICTGALALEDCASLRIVDVVELRKLMAGVQAGFAHASDVHSEACRRAIAEAERFTGKGTT